MRIFLNLLFIVIWMSSANAQTVTVRSGEHDTFSRLALTLPEGTGWTVKNRADGATISIRQDDVLLDVSNVFARIPRRRLKDVIVRGSDLELVFGCACTMTTSLIEANMLVLDITDLPMTASAPETSQRRVPVSDRRYRFGYGELLWATEPRRRFAVASGAPETVPERTGPSGQISPEATGPETPTPENLQTEIASNIARAASQGLLDPKLQLNARDVERVKPKQDLEDASPGEAEIGTAPADARTNIQIRSSLDAPRFGAGKKGQTDNGYVCPDPDLVRIDEWGDDRSFGSQIGPRRAEILQEFDRLNLGAAADLARAYLYFGFGIEARRVLEMDDALLRENPFLLIVSDILDTGSGQSGNMLLPYSECDSAFALWSVLAHEKVPASTAINVNAILLGFASLPVHLRELLGPVLSNRLLTYGDPEASASVMRIVNRTPDVPTADMTMADANIALQKDDFARAEQMLTRVLDTNSENSPRALIKIIDSRMERDLPVSVETAALAAAFAKEHRNSELGPDLRRVHVLARSRANQFGIAFGALSQLAERDDVSGQDTLRSQVLSHLTQNADDVTFLYHALQQSQLERPIADNQIANAIAERILTIGFPELALQFLDESSDKEETVDRRLLQGKIALALGNPEGAENELAGLGGPMVDVLKADVRMTIGDYVQAGRIYDMSGETQKAVQAAWLSENWSRLSGSDHSSYAEFARVMEAGGRSMTPAVMVDDKPAIQDAGRRLIEDTAEFRVALQSVFSNGRGVSPDRREPAEIR